MRVEQTILQTDRCQCVTEKTRPEHLLADGTHILFTLGYWQCIEIEMFATNYPLDEKLPITVDNNEYNTPAPDVVSCLCIASPGLALYQIMISS